MGGSAEGVKERLSVRLRVPVRFVLKTDHCREHVPDAGHGRLRGCRFVPQDHVEEMLLRIDRLLDALRQGATFARVEGPLDLDHAKHRLGLDDHEVFEPEDGPVVNGIVDQQINLWAVTLATSPLYPTKDEAFVYGHSLQQVAAEEIAQKDFAMSAGVGPVVRQPEELADVLVLGQEEFSLAGVELDQAFRQLFHTQLSLFVGVTHGAGAWERLAARAAPGHAKPVLPALAD
jgi:hypothetical protein